MTHSHNQKTIIEFNVYQNGELLSRHPLEGGAFQAVADAFRLGNKMKHFKIKRFTYAENGTMVKDIFECLASGRE